MAGRESFRHPNPDRVDTAEIVGVVERYVATVNARDSDGNRATMTVPHVRIGGAGDVLTLPDDESLSRLTSFRTLEQ